MARNLAIAVGINQYPLLDQPLRYAEQDAIAMRDFLKNEAGFEPVYLFSDNAPTVGDKTAQPFRNNLLMVLDQIAAKVRLQENDSLWFFFSGHGARQTEQDYLLLSDSYLGNLQETAISTDRIIRSLRQCGAGNLIMILDACRNRVRDASKGIGSQTVELAKQEGVISLFSCRPSQMSYEITALNQGAFTYVLLEALRGDCQPHSTTVEQLDRYLLKRVPELNRQHSQQAQEPYLIAEPARKYHQILLPSNVAPPPPSPPPQDTVDRLKSEAFHATYVVKDLDQAKQLWRRVNEIAADPEDRKLAVDRIEEIAQMQRDQNPPVSSNSYSQAIPQSPKTAYPPPVDSKYRQESFHNSSKQAPKAAPQPPIEPIHRQEAVRQSTNQSSKAPSAPPVEPANQHETVQQSPSKNESEEPFSRDNSRNRSIPWIVLITVLSISIIAGFDVAQGATSLWLSLLTLTGVWAVAVACVGAWALTLFVIWYLFMCFVLGSVSAGAWVAVLVGALVEVWAGVRLLESFQSVSHVPDFSWNVLVGVGVRALGVSAGSGVECVVWGVASDEGMR